MPQDRSVYQDPLVSRYTSKRMQNIFSEEFKFQTWRQCWIALAEGQMELGLDYITPAMINELVAAQKTIDYAFAEAEEKTRRHDVMAHIHEYASHCPTAGGIIHLGETSQFVVCNTDLIQMKEALPIIRKGLVNVIYNLTEIAEQHKGIVTLAYTHYQPAEPTTIGKRITLYIRDLIDDLDAIEAIQFKARGTKGTTGTQASHLGLFKGDYQKVRALDRLVAKKLGFDDVFPVTGQTYPRKFDIKVAEALAGVGMSLYKFADDFRLMSNLKIVDEPFEVDQTGSTAMPFKRNPMRFERICGLSRKLMGLVPDFYATASLQWLERTLDDSSIRRMDIPQGFLLTEAILILANNITNKNVDPEKTTPLTFYPKRIERLLNEELPFMATEAIMLDLASKGHDRQKMHKIIETHSVAAARAIKEDGTDNDLFKRLGNDENFPLSEAELSDYLLKPERFVGPAAQQTEDYLAEVVRPRLVRYKDIIGQPGSEVKV